MPPLTGPLSGHHILITRPAGQADALMAGVRALGGQATHVPFLSITPVRDPALALMASALTTYQAVLFISANAVQSSWSTLTNGMPWPPSLPAATVGPGTARHLRERGVKQVLMPDQQFDSEGLLALPFFAPVHCEGRSFALIRGEGGRDLLAQRLRAMGARVDEAACYQRALSPAAVPELQSLFPMGPADQVDVDASIAPSLVVVSSSESLQRLMQAMPPSLAAKFRSLPMLVPHGRIAEVARSLGFRQVMVTAGGDRGILEALRTYNQTSSITE